MKNKYFLILSFLAGLGVIFSGILTYSEFFKNKCLLGGGCVNILNIPSCAYGFLLFLLILIFIFLAFKQDDKTEVVRHSDNFDRELDKLNNNLNSDEINSSS